MRIVIAVATADASLRAFLASNRDRAVPPEIACHPHLSDRGSRFSIQLQAINQGTTSDDLGCWLERLSKGAEGLILLIDASNRFLVQDFEDAYFVTDIPPYKGKVAQNQVRAALAPILRHFVAYSQRFDHKRNLRVLLLPLDIFIADDLADLRGRMTTGKMAPGLGEDIDRLIAAVNRRGRPKTKRGSYSKIFLVDDRPLFYQYGPERHKIVQTVMPPHGEKCRHLSRFRFGRLYDDRLHHNVDDGSKPTKVSGSFTTCHGDIFAANGQSHLNIFPNGFI